jgi:hypothetical protein
MTTTAASTPRSTTTQATPISRRAQIAGWVISGVVSALLLIDAISHLAMPQGVKEATYELGLTDGDAVAMGMILLGCVALYLVPRTAILGAVLLTGYLGGAVTALMVSEEAFAAGGVFPVAAGAIAWAGLWLRSSTVRSILPLTPR